MTSPTPKPDHARMVKLARAVMYDNAIDPPSSREKEIAQAYLALVERLNFTDLTYEISVATEHTLEQSQEIAIAKAIRRHCGLEET